MSSDKTPNINSDPHNRYYIGVMSGTSADGIDVALLDFNKPIPELIASYSQTFDQDTRESILALCSNGDNEIHRLGALDRKLAEQYASCINTLLENSQISKSNVVAIGCHGQTIRHAPPSCEAKHPFTLQIGDINYVAQKTGIPTVGDFRRRLIGLGGEGAPLVPAFHNAVFTQDKKPKVIANIGGMANITSLNYGDTLGFDTGPGNALLDLWIHKHLNKRFDEDGRWAATGTVIDPLLHKLLEDPFFTAPPPKSTGRELFTLEWLSERIDQSHAHSPHPEDVQATLTELTAISVIRAATQYCEGGDIYICGGGAFNPFLLARLQSQTPRTIFTTQSLGIAPQWMEAAAFAWLAKQRIDKTPIDLRLATGASDISILGGLYLP